MKIEIHAEKNCAWCEINGMFIYGKNEAELRNMLDAAAKGNVQ